LRREGVVLNTGDFAVNGDRLNDQVGNIIIVGIGLGFIDCP
jgi:hypothetical protein